MTVNRTETSRVEIDNAQVDGTGLPVKVMNVIPGGASAANQVLEIADLDAINAKLPALSGGRVPVVLPAGGGGLTDTELRATPVPVSIAAAVALDAPSLAALETISVANFPATQPISAVALPLPAGAALDATLTGGTAKAIARGGQKGTTNTNADITHTPSGANHEALDVILYDAAGNVIDPRSIRALTNADVVKAQLQDDAGTAVTVGQKAMATSLPIVIASNQSIIPVTGDIDHDAVNTLKNIQMAGHASPVDVPPALVSASGDRVRQWLDRAGSSVVRRRKLRESYTAVFRLAEAAVRLDQTFTQVANTNKQWATLHHTAAATKEVRLMKCVCYITAWTIASQAILELRQISAAPATGNPAITPTPHRRGGTAAEAVALYLPTTAGTEPGVNTPLGHAVIDYGIMGAVSTLNPMPLLNPIVLYDASQEDDEELPPVLPVGVLDGWAVMLRTVGIPAVRMVVMMRFTEEIP